MEAAGLAVSIPALVTTIRALTDLCCNFYDAPKELTRIQSQLLILNAELQVIDQLQQNQDTPEANALPNQLLEACARALDSAKTTISSILEAVKPQRVGGFRARLRWSFIGNAKTKQLLDHLRGTEISLITVFSLLSWYQARNHDTLSDLVSMTLELQKEIATLKVPLPVPFQHHSQQASQTTLSSLNAAPNSDRSGSSLVVLSKAAQFGIPDGHRLRASLSSYGNEEQTTRLLSVRALLPFAWLIGQRAFVLDLALRSYTACSLAFSPLSGSWLGLANIISDDAEIMQACQQGDLVAVRDLIRTGQAKPSDTTMEFNYTPLTNAVMSGNVELVDFLLRNGANVNTLFGRLQTSYLAWALKYRHEEVVRLLLERGADLHHISAVGWTPIFYLWSQAHRQEKPSVSFLRMMSAKNEFYPFDCDVRDVQGWDILQRAAAFGTAEDVRALISLGARTDNRIGDLKWRAIHEAVFHNNLPTFIELLPYNDAFGIECVDERGWTFLHIAASAGHDKIVRYLLTLGADAFRKTQPFWSYMPESLYGQSWTPAEVARAQSQQRYEQYLQALIDFGHVPDVKDAEIFFDAIEAHTEP